MARRKKAEAGEQPIPTPPATKPVKASKKPQQKASTGKKPNTKAKRAPKAKAAPAVVVASTDGIVAQTVSEPVKRKTGRPTTYKEEYCDLVIEWGKQGKSRTWIAAQLDTTRETLDDWQKANPSFSDALLRAKIYEQAFWEDQGQTGMVSDKFNSAVWAKNMSCRFRSDWTEKQTVEHEASSSFVAMLRELNGSSASLVG